MIIIQALMGQHAQFAAIQFLIIQRKAAKIKNFSLRLYVKNFIGNHSVNG
jgi:hypothetical protein